MIRLSSFPCWSGQLLLSALVCVAAPMVVSGCGAETTPEVVTETGNPPFLDPDKIRVELTGTDATVSGEEGAVPPNAAVLVTNTESGESASTSADDEGAFSVTLPAQEDDEFEVQVESRNRTQTLDLTVAAETESTEPENTEAESAGAEPTTPGSEGLGPPVASSTDTPPVRSIDGPSFADAVADVLDQRCTFGCHEPGGLVGGPGGVDPLVQQDLTGASSYATLTRQRSKQVPTMWLVGSGLVDSYLWYKLNDTHLSVGGTGAKMPMIGVLTAEELALVQAWIEGGAAP